MEFKEFKELMQSHVELILKDQSALFVVDVNTDWLWYLYLWSFPDKFDPVFRDKTNHNCSCCRHFIRQFGNVVAIRDGKMISIWDFEADEEYQPSIDEMSALVHSAPIRDVFVSKDRLFGTNKNRELVEVPGGDDYVRTWEHFFISIPGRFVSRSTDTKAGQMAKYRSVTAVFARSLNEISLDAIETVLDLIAQKSLYKGEEWQGALEKFLALHQAYWLTPEHERGVYCWAKSVEVGGAIGKIKNHSIGVLLMDISNGVDLNDAVRKYEAMVAPENYKRPKAIFTKKMVENAYKVMDKLGLEDSLGRRHATLDDVRIDNIIWANRDTAQRIAGGSVFDDLLKDAKSSRPNFDRVEEIPIEHFIKNVLPRCTSVEAFVEGHMTPNFMSLIAPVDQNGELLFKWPNGMTWAYSGNIADSSIRERVKAAGGNVDGVLGYRIQWNDGSHHNRNDLDAHCVEPDGRRIYYGATISRKTGGNLDVDIMNPKAGIPAVENITHPNMRRMLDGLYSYSVKNYSHRGGRNGFKAEIEFDGQLYLYEYNRELRRKEIVPVANVRLHNGKFEMAEEFIDSQMSSREVWGVRTNQFHPVSVVMFSPNYWDGQVGIGHRHYFFMLPGCLNDTQPNGFYNEFLKEEFMPHKRVFEALGSHMRVANSDDQLSGIGFSSTKRDSLVVKLEGHTKRIVRVVF